MIKKLKKTMLFFIVLGAALLNFSHTYSIGTKAEPNLKTFQDNLPVTQSVYSTATPTATDDIGSPAADDCGNSSETSREIQSNTKVEGSIDYINDYDYFSFKPKKEGNYNLRDFAAKTHNIYYDEPYLGHVVNIYDSDLRYFQMTYIDDYNATFYFEKDHTYYFVVSSASYDYLFNYSFYIEGPLDDDIGNTKELAKDIQIGSKVTGTGNYYKDKDYFCFEPSVEGTYYIDDFGSGDLSSSSLNSTISFCGSIEGLPNNYTKGSKLYFDLSKGTKYYVMVDNYSQGLPSEYSFTIKGPLDDDIGHKIESAKEIQIDDQIEVIGNFYGDKDYVKISAAEDGVYCISDFRKSGNKLNNPLSILSVLDSNFSWINTPYTDSNIYFRMQKSKVYYIAINNDNDTDEPVSYTFSIKGPESDDYGDTNELSKELHLDDTVNGILNYSNDVDCFSFTPSEDGTYYIERPSSANPNDYYFTNRMFSINDYYGGIVDTHYGNSFSTKLYFYLKKDMKYYIMLTNNYDGLWFSYNFKLKGPVLDDYGNTKETSSLIQLNSEIKGESGNFFDMDYFKFQPSKSGKYYLEYLSAFYLGTTDPYTNMIDCIQLIDSNDNKVNIKYDYLSLKAYFDLSKDTTYYISLTNTKYYRLYSYSFMLKGPVNDDFGNTPSYAKPLEFGTEIDGSIDYKDDNDYFSFKTDSKGIYSLSIPETGNWNITLYDEKFNVVSYRLNSYPFNTEKGKLFYYLSTAQTYFICLYSYNSTNYSITVDKYCTDDYDNMAVESPIVNINSPLKGSIDFIGDIDTFRFIPDHTGDFYFKIMGNNSTIKISYPNNSDFNISQKVLDKNIVCANLTENTAYIISVKGLGWLDTGNYALTISDTPDILTSNTYKIIGYVKPDFTINSSSPLKSGFIVELEGIGLSAVTDENGYFEIVEVPETITGYDIIISKDGYLKREINSVVIDGDTSISNTESPIDMWAGNLADAQDNIINLSDVIQISKSFNTKKGDEVYSDSADINGDSVINIQDIMLVAQHFNQASSDYPVILIPNR